MTSKFEIEGLEYQRIPESWIDYGVDDDAPDGPQLLAVSVTLLRPSTFKIRYAHPRHGSIGALSVPTQEGNDGLVPDGDLDPWSRSVGASRLTPVDVIRDPEREALLDLWADRVEEVLENPPQDSGDDKTLIADGGSPNPHWLFRAQIAHSRLREDVDRRNVQLENEGICVEWGDPKSTLERLCVDCEDTAASFEFQQYVFDGCEEHPRAKYACRSCGLSAYYAVEGYK